MVCVTAAARAWWGGRHDEGGDRGREEQNGGVLVGICNHKVTLSAVEGRGRFPKTEMTRHLPGTWAVSMTTASRTNPNPTK